MPERKRGVKKGTFEGKTQRSMNLSRDFVAIRKVF